MTLEIKDRNKRGQKATTEVALLNVLTEKVWELIVVDVGSKGFVSTNVEDDELLIMIDPDMDVHKIEWGDNEADGGRVISIKAKAKVLEKYLPGFVDRIQFIAPDPKEAHEMLDEAFPLLKVGGKAVLIFDINSNKADKVKLARRGIISSYSDHEIEIIDPDDIDLSELIGGELNSDIIVSPENTRVLVIQKKH